MRKRIAECQQVLRGVASHEARVIAGAREVRQYDVAEPNGDWRRIRGRLRRACRSYFAHDICTGQQSFELVQAVVADAANRFRMRRRRRNYSGAIAPQEVDRHAIDARLSRIERSISIEIVELKT